MRWSRALVFVLVALFVVACGSPAASTDGEGGGDPSTAASAAPASAAGLGNVDVDDVFNALIPPNSTEVSKVSAGGAIVAAYTSTDSLESLVSFYESAIPGNGMQILQTQSVEGGTGWIFVAEADSTFGGGISVFPQGDTVQVTVTVGNGTVPSAEPSFAGGPGIPDEAELQRRYDCIIAALGPPGGTEVAREPAGELDLGIFFESTETFAALEAFYAQAIPAAGFQIIEERNDFPGVHEWMFTSGETFQPFITLEGDPGGGGGSTVGMGLLGIPPEC